MAENYEIKKSRTLLLTTALQILIPVALISIYLILATDSWSNMFNNYEKERMDSNLVRMVQIGKSAIADNIQLLRNGRITQAEGVILISSQLRQMTYQDDFGKNYFFLVDEYGNGLVNPFDPEFEGRNHWNEQNQDGSYYVQEIVKAAKANVDGGFVSYEYPLPGTDIVERKFSYVVYIPEIKAVMGTGVYLDTYTIRQNEFIQKTQQTLVGLMILTFVAIGFGIVRIYRNDASLSKEIHERRKAQNEAQLAEVNFREVFDRTYDGLLIHDIHGQFVRANKRLLEMYEMKESDISSATVFDIWPGTDTEGKECLQNIHELWKEIADGAETLLDIKGKKYHKDELFDLELALRPIDWYGDRLVLAVLRDITERKTDERKLRDSEERFRTVVEQLDEGLTLVNKEGQILVWNTALEKMMGMSRDDAIHRNTWDVQFDLLPMEKRSREQYNKFKDISNQVLVERNLDMLKLHRQFEFSNPLGDKRILEEKTFKIQSSGEEWFATVFRDVTEQQKVQARMEYELQKILSLQRIDASIIGQKPLEEILRGVIHEAKEHLEIDAIQILRLDEKKEHLYPITSEGMKIENQECVEYAQKRGLSWETAQAKKLFWYEFPENNCPFDCSCIACNQYRVYIGIPISANQGMIGLIEVFLKERRSFDEEWAEYLVTLAGQAAIAVEASSMLRNLELTNQKLTQAYEATITGWSKALELRDEETQGHSDRVTYLSIELAKRMGIQGAELEHFRRGVLLHDIGKMGIPDSILLKPGPLTEEEWQIMRRHPQFAFDLLSPIEYLRPALDIPHHHHERWDGSGYPAGLTGENIPLFARIFAVVDVWDALVVDRPYRGRLEHAEARAYLIDQSGVMFDPAVVQEFLALMDSLEEDGLIE